MAAGVDKYVSAYVRVAPEVGVEWWEQVEFIVHFLVDDLAEECSDFGGGVVLTVELKLQFSGCVALATHELNHVVAFERFSVGNDLPEEIEGHLRYSV